MISYGDRKVVVDSQDEDGNPLKVEITVAELIAFELGHDQIRPDNPVYAAIWDEFQKHIDGSGVVPDQRYFISHPDPAISALTVDLLSTPYHLSNWEQHEIYVTTEEDILKKSIYNAIYALKSRRLEMMIAENQKRLSQKIDEEEMMQLLQTQQQLLEAKKVFNNLLGRIIVK